MCSSTLLHHIQGALPQWSAVSGDEIILNRKEHKRHKDARLGGCILGILNYSEKNELWNGIAGGQSFVSSAANTLGGDIGRL